MASKHSPANADPKVAATAIDDAPAPKEAAHKQASLAQMYRYATWLDVASLLVGTICACINGAAFAGFSIIMGSILNSINSPTGVSHDSLLLLVSVGIATWAAAAIQVFVFTMVAERLTVRLREAYLESILDQDITYFDTTKPGELSTVLAENAVLYQEGLGERLANLFQSLSLFFAGIIVGFVYSWKLTLVILSVAPLLVACFAFMAKSMRANIAGRLEAYARAGAIAEETFTLIRTVTGLGIQTSRVEKFDQEVQSAAAKSVTLGLNTGIGLGLSFGTFYAMFGLSFWVGALFVTQDRTAAAQSYPLNPVLAPSFCVVGGQVSRLCSTQPVYPGLVWNTMADVCGCPACHCGCYEPGGTASCLLGGNIITVFFSVLFVGLRIACSRQPLTPVAAGRRGPRQSGPFVFGADDRAHRGVPHLRGD
jgi:ABC-type multidrug transport system fused ATPase/permease subunit